MMEIDLAVWLAGSICLFLVGIYGLISSRDTIRSVISIELLLISVNTVFIGMGFFHAGSTAVNLQNYAILSLSIGGSIISLALVYVSRIYNSRQTTDIAELTELKW